MMYRVLTATFAAALLVAALFAVAAPVSADHPGEGGAPLSAALIPTISGVDGGGTATFRLNPGQEEICYDLLLEGIAEPFAAHIHTFEGGGIAVPFPDPPLGTSSGCVPAPREVIIAIIQNPSGYYFNVHNTQRRAGILQGSLTR